MRAKQEVINQNFIVKKQIINLMMEVNYSIFSAQTFSDTLLIGYHKDFSELIIEYAEGFEKFWDRDKII